MVAGKVSAVERAIACNTWSKVTLSPTVVLTSTISSRSVYVPKRGEKFTWNNLLKGLHPPNANEMKTVCI